MKWHKRKWSEFTHRDIARSLIWYYRDFREEDEYANKRYEQLWKKINYRYFDIKLSKENRKKYGID
jgi:hypothetical protein